MKQLSSALSILVLCAPVLLPARSLAQAAPGDDKSPAFTIVGARVYDGERWLPAGTQVRVQRGLVFAVGPDVGVARGATVIDATGKTLLPEQTDGDTGDGRAAAPSPAERLQSGRGAIVAGAHADLRLVDGDASQSWASLGGIIARWKNGILVNHRGAAMPRL
ncbi:MAG: hypothetical protein P4L83_22180 [Nevskia sp.]|nr:hypothetical protein [Nevskia sp.]